GRRRASAWAQSMHLPAAFLSPEAAPMLCSCRPRAVEIVELPARSGAGIPVHGRCSGHTGVMSGLTDDEAMEVALAHADDAATWGDVPVGAVVLSPEGEVLAAAGNRREADGDPTGHAEILALRAAGLGREDWRLSDCTLVVTLEPCTMCAGALVLARVRRVVLGAWDEKAGACGSTRDVVRDSRL